MHFNVIAGYTFRKMLTLLRLCQQEGQRDKQIAYWSQQGYLDKQEQMTCGHGLDLGCDSQSNGLDRTEGARGGCMGQRSIHYSGHCYTGVFSPRGSQMGAVIFSYLVSWRSEFSRWKAKAKFL